MADQTTVDTQRGTSGALDAPTDLDTLVRVDTERYYEREDHVPDALYQTGTLDTSDTAGPAHASIDEVSPVFARSRVANLVTAARALDPEDHEVPAELVTLPQGSVTVVGSIRSADDARDEIAGKLRAFADNPVTVGGPSPAQQAAAEETGDPSTEETRTAEETRAAESTQARAGGRTRTTPKS